jgi:hypothetical protein
VLLPELREVRECFMLLSEVCLSAAGVRECCIGLATEFRSKKVPWNRLGLASVTPRKEVLIPRHSEFYGRVNF